MSTNPKPAYRRILLKLSGEALQGEKALVSTPPYWSVWLRKSRNWLNWAFRSAW
jgi:uridylate kinase